MTKAPLCPYCGNPAEFYSTSERFYQCEKDFGPLWACVRCNAWVGCHKGTTTPLGRLAGPMLRRMKMDAHAAFDPLWKTRVAQGMSKKEARGRGYKWLAEQLGIAPEDCHIGEMDVPTCRRVIALCAPYTRKLTSS